MDRLFSGKMAMQQSEIIVDSLINDVSFIRRNKN